ncbi:MAG TPA: hypothetical protein DG754_07745, partial [Bacteroidales bacterium]|nr:hypothetical protein [Bacteroidales bacterium]
GKDIPESPTNVLLLMVGNDAKITWNAPVTGHNGGYIVPENTTYSIIRMPDETEVATNLNALEYIDNSIPSPGNYLYIVTAHNEEGEGGNAP